MAKILYVEDHPPAQFLMQAIIDEMTDHELLLAGSGKQAQEITTAQHPDLYIVDLDLPDSDGISLARILAGIHSAPVILVSAYAEAIKPATSIIYFYMAKPLDPEHVAETIQRALAR